jgi:hypothetical protein
MKQIKNVIKEIKDRLMAKTPSFFKYIIRIGLSISGVSLAIHEAMIASGAIEPQWWVDIYPYLIAIPAGMTATAKLTREYGPDKKQNNDK